MSPRWWPSRRSARERTTWTSSGGQPLATDLARFDRLAFVTRRPSRAGLGGEHASRRRAPSAEFVDYRPYVPGDDLRRVDWNVYGRLGALEVKLTEARERAELVLALDCSASMAWGTPDKFAAARQVAAALAYIGLARFDRVRIVRLGYSGAERCLGPVHGRTRLSEVLGFLERSRPVGQLDLNQQLPDGSARRGQHLLILISDLLTPGGIGPTVDALQASGTELVVVHVVAPQERQPETLGDLELIDAESRGVLEVGLSNDVLRVYCTRFAGWLEHQRQLCLGRGARYVLAATDRPISALMLSDMRQAAILQ
ncbi:MAG: DUF58 domain-containing protein [Chloroflexi bacterium]|nr:DUF58 domain-containing protein [Chloroflexota bacterium]